MNYSDYKHEVMADAIQAVNFGEYDDCESSTEALEHMFYDDSITGNGSGSYTFCTWQAEQNTRDLFWDEPFIDLLDEMRLNIADFLRMHEAEALDVTARCLALDEPDVREEIADAWNTRQEMMIEAAELALLEAYPVTC